MTNKPTYCIGIDTGGTYTDAVIFDKSVNKVLHTAKSFTTKKNLIEGITACLNKLPLTSYIPIKLVCLSTTLATNAIVEDKGARVGIVFIGKKPEGNLPDAICSTIPGLVDIQGRIIEPLNINDTRNVLRNMKNNIDALVVSGYASVRNADMELMVSDIAKEELPNVPVVCTHQLVGSLGYFDRSVTAILNAKLIPIINELIESVKKSLVEQAIDCPLMIVRGDGYLMEAGYALNRPIETVLSGPAASAIGALFLHPLTNGLIIDIGGTTTDVVRIDNGKIQIKNEGANIGIWKTKVKATDIYTIGLGGDSLIKVGLDKEIQIGPRKVIPVCVTTAFDTEFEDIGQLTPTDIFHAEGAYSRWNYEASIRTINEMAKVAKTTSSKLILSIKEKIIEQLKKVCTKATEENLDLESVVAIGAPAISWRGMIDKGLNVKTIVPLHAEVANAIGAVVGNVSQVQIVLIRPDSHKKMYIVYTSNERLEFKTLSEAKDCAIEKAKKISKQEMILAGSKSFESFVTEKEIYATNSDDKKILVEVQIKVITIGAPSFHS